MRYLQLATIFIQNMFFVSTLTSMYTCVKIQKSLLNYKIVKCWITFGCLLHHANMIRYNTLQGSYHYVSAFRIRKRGVNVIVDIFDCVKFVLVDQVCFVLSQCKPPCGMFMVLVCVVHLVSSMKVLLFICITFLCMCFHSCLVFHMIFSLL